MYQPSVTALMTGALVTGLLLVAACSSNGPRKEIAPPQSQRLYSVADFVLALKTEQAGLPYRVRERLLQTSEAPTAGAEGPQRVQMHTAIENMHFGAEVAIFPGRTPAETVYLYSAGSDLPDCQGVRAWLGSQDRVGPHFCRQDEALGLYQLQSSDARRFGFSAYRFDDDGRPRDVTDAVFPPDPVLNLPAGERYAVHDETGRSHGARADLSRLPNVLVIRLYLELGDGGGLPRSHPRALPGNDSGERVHTAHFGFLVWNGKRFDLREKVTRKLWPCIGAGRAPPDRDTCTDMKQDPFILPPDTPEASTGISRARKIVSEVFRTYLKIPSARVPPGLDKIGARSSALLDRGPTTTGVAHFARHSIFAANAAASDFEMGSPNQGDSEITQRFLEPRMARVRITRVSA